MNQTDLQSRAVVRLEEAKLLLAGNKPCGAYYLAGYAVECALKACIAKQTQQGEFPVDEFGLPMPVAYWEWTEAHQAWRLVLTSPEVDVKGPLFFISHIRQILEQMGDDERGGLSMNDVAVRGFNINSVKNIRRQYASFMAYGTKGEVPPQNAREAYEQKEPFIYRLA